MFSLSRSAGSHITASFRMLTVGVSLAAMGMLPNVVSAQSWYGTLLGTNEVPANMSTATGSVFLSLSGNSLSVVLNWNGLSTPVTAGHIHCCAAPNTNVGVAVGFTGLPSSLSGSYSNMFDLGNSSTYTTTFVTSFGGGTVAGAQMALVNGLNSGLAYVNLHNAQFPGGEIRANVTVTPEPASVAMFALGLFAVGVVVRRNGRAQ